jgi:hypothetical protein
VEIKKYGIENQERIEIRIPLLHAVHPQLYPPEEEQEHEHVPDPEEVNPVELVSVWMMDEPSNPTKKVRDPQTHDDRDEDG